MSTLSKAAQQMLSQVASSSMPTPKGNVLYAMVIFEGSSDTSPAIVQSYEPLIIPEVGQRLEIRKGGATKEGKVASVSLTFAQSELTLNITAAVVLG